MSSNDTMLDGIMNIFKQLPNYGIFSDYEQNVTYCSK